MNRLFVADNPQKLYDAYTEAQIGDAPVLSTAQLLAGEADIHTEYLFSTWGMPTLTVEQIQTLLPQLKAVFYAAGSVQYFARPYLTAGVKIFSAWAANAIPVSEFVLAQILLAGKGYFQMDGRYRRQGIEAVRAYSAHFLGNYQSRVGLLGAGMIGRRVIQLLKPFDLNVLVYDPFLSEEDAAALGVQKASLEEIFESCFVISNHLANNAQTQGMLDYRLFSRMGDYATFINTGRGAQLVEADLIRAMKEQPGRTALLDVTDPHEPLAPDSPLWQCENIFISPHQAGSLHREIYRMGEWMQQAYEGLLAGADSPYEVTLPMLERMA
jgi:phosphoglycerate dehydrogenase-like enzyme